MLMFLRTTALDIPFLLLPFRPASDPSAARTFIRNFFKEENGMQAERLTQELLLTEPMVHIRDEPCIMRSRLNRNRY